MAEIQRKTAADQQKVQLEAQRLQTQSQQDQARMQLDAARLQMEAQRMQADMQAKAAELQVKQASTQVDMAKEVERQNREDMRTAAEIEARQTMNIQDNTTALELAKLEIASGEKFAVSTGTGINPGTR